MLRTRLEIVNPYGLHARVASLVAHAMRRFDAHILFEWDGRRADGRSVLSLLLLGAAEGAELTVTAQGREAREALRAVEELFASGFGEITGTAAPVQAA